MNLLISLAVFGAGCAMFAFWLLIRAFSKASSLPLTLVLLATLMYPFKLFLPDSFLIWHFSVGFVVNACLGPVAHWFFASLFFPTGNFSAARRFSWAAVLSGILFFLGVILFSGPEFRSDLVAAYYRSMKLTDPFKLVLLSYPIWVQCGSIFAAAIQALPVLRQRADAGAGGLKVLWFALAALGLVLVFHGSLRLFGSPEDYQLGQLALMPIMFFLAYVLVRVLKNDASLSRTPARRHRGGAYEKSSIAKLDIERLRKVLELKMTKDQVFRDSQLSLPRLSKSLGVAPWQLSELFNRYYGKSFAGYLASYRIDAAKKDLVDRPEKTVLDVLLDCGFNSKSSFNASFLSSTGLSPREYRKKHLNSKESRDGCGAKTLGAEEEK